MYITDQIIYIQMQKTACTHIAKLLSSLFDGKQVGKHNAASAKQINSGTYFFISSIRNPWDWYLSLWTFGIQGNGAFRRRLTYRNYRRAIKLFVKNPLRGYSALLHEAKKDVSLWRDLYDGQKSLESFRKWLKHIHTQKNACILGEGYGESTITEFCGFMTYRYLYLCCSEPWMLYSSKIISNYIDLERYEQNSCYIDYFIHQESLESDFIKAVEKIKTLTEYEKNQITCAKKTNSSKRSFSISEYYDDESINIVRNREKLLIEKFSYIPPPIVK